MKKEFPTATPSIGGYTLVDAFPGVLFDIPAAIVWPKNAGYGADPFVLERTGQIRRPVGGARVEVLSFADQVHVADEGGALGLALHPKFADGTGTHDFAYVWYNACQNAGCTYADPAYSQRLQRYTWSTTLNAFDPASVVTMIEEREFQTIHNAGKMEFGPTDGFLYFTNGDDNTIDNQQTITNGLFAGIFRIDVDSDTTKSHAFAAHSTSHAGGVPQTPFTRTGYMIPNDNPFVGVTNALEEFYAVGFRNPFSFSFDKTTGQLWMGDVGDSFREEVNLVTKGGNYQWPLFEGDLNNADSQVTTLIPGTTGIPPKYAYPHSEMADLSAVFGGNIYRGTVFPELAGKYLYTDWISNDIFALDVSMTPPLRTTLVQNQYELQPLNIGEDLSGELYFLQYGSDQINDPTDFSGHIKKLAPDTSAQALPTTLSATTLFDDVASLTPAANLVAYTVSSPLWSDGAGKQRWIRLPAGQKATYDATTGSLHFPVGTVFVKQFDVPSTYTAVGRSNHIETRVMVVGDSTTWGYTFRWNTAGTDATMVTEPQDETITDTMGGTRNWHYPSFRQCWKCHRDDAETGTAYQKDKWRILGFTAAQLGVMIGGVDQRTTLAAAGVFDPADVAMMPPVLPSPSDTTQTIETRAFAYLAANCSPCHHDGASYTGGGQTWLATYGAGDINARFMNQPANNYPMTVRLGIPGGNIVQPGDPTHSILLARIQSNDPDLRMPPLARNVVDTDGAAIIQQWIASLTP